MPKLYSSGEIESVLLKIGFVFKSQKGSPGKFKHADGKTVILRMNKKEVPIGTFRSILIQANLTLEEFEKLS